MIYEIQIKYNQINKVIPSPTCMYALLVIEVSINVSPNNATGYYIDNYITDRVMFRC